MVSYKSINHRQRQQGSATVEVAICLPIFLIVIFGVIECCDLLFLRQGVLQAAYEGARVAIVPKSKPDNVVEQVERILGHRGIQASGIRIIPPDFERAPFGTQVMVEIQAEPGENGKLMRLFRNRVITGRATMMIENDRT
jgi:hypothetical protein